MPTPGKLLKQPCNTTPLLSSLRTTTHQPSEADKRITERLKQALALIDIRVLDHFVIGYDETVSFAEKGYL